MIIVPLRREDGDAQRYAWVTYGLIVLNVLMFILFCADVPDEREQSLIVTWRNTVSFLRERPYLRVPPRVAELMPRDLRQRTPAPDPRVPSWKADTEQGEVTEMAGELRGLYDTTPSIQLAYVPAIGGWFTILTSMFLHAGLMHLLGNMIFLYATGPFVEDAFGRILFAALYLTSGVVATLAFGFRFPDEILPLVGASGAIAAVMGAYLVRFTLSRIQFLVMPVLFLPFWNYRFSLPALVVLPLWFLEQVVAVPSEGESGVAVTAHVSGFAYGAVVAMVFRLLGPKPVVVAKPQPLGPRIERALAASRANDFELAGREVNHLLAEQPNHIDALRLSLDFALRSTPSTVDALATRLLDAYAAAGDRTNAIALITRITATKHPRQFLARAAAHLERWNMRHEAVALLERLAEIESGTTDAIPTLFKLATMRRADGDRDGAKQALQRALADTSCSEQWRRRIDNAIAMLG